MKSPQRPNGAMMERLVLFKTLSHTIVRFDPTRLASGEYLRCFSERLFKLYIDRVKFTACSLDFK
jgi:hypothetical protein